MNLIKNTINKIKEAEKLALTMNEKGFYLAFSGGKDSQVIYHLFKEAGVKFESHMQLTTVDPPELLKFIKKNYPDVILHKPNLSMFQLIKKKKQLPSRVARFCCSELKETAGIGFITVIGIRASESNKRAKRKEFEVQCLGKKGEKGLYAPIIKYTNADVWNFIRNNEIEYSSLYDNGFKRIGCIFCPLASRKIKQHERLLFPRFEYAYKKSIQFLIDNYGYMQRYTNSSDEIFNWWISNESCKKYFGSKNQTSLNL